jgi:hypothetical protein
MRIQWKRWRVAAALTCLAVVPAAAADVRDALRGKTIVLSWSESDREMDVASGAEYPYSVKTEARLFFGADGQIATRYDRTFNDKRAFSASQTFDANGSLLTGPASGVFKIVKIEFNGRGLAASLIWGNHGAQQIAVAVGPAARSCVGNFMQGTDTAGATEYIAPVDGKLKRSISRQVSGIRCQIANGDAING